MSNQKMQEETQLTNEKDAHLIKKYGKEALDKALYGVIEASNNKKYSSLTSLDFLEVADSVLSKQIAAIANDLKAQYGEDNYENTYESNAYQDFLNGEINAFDFMGSAREQLEELYTNAAKEVMDEHGIDAFFDAKAKFEAENKEKTSNDFEKLEGIQAMLAQEKAKAKAEQEAKLKAEQEAAAKKAAEDAAKAEKVKHGLGKIAMMENIVPKHGSIHVSGETSEGVGAVIEAPNGMRRLVRVYADNTQTYCEALAAHFYGAVGVPALKPKLVYFKHVDADDGSTSEHLVNAFEGLDQFDNGQLVGNSINESHGGDLTAKNCQDIVNGLAADMILGARHITNTLHLNKQGTAVRIQNGSALLYAEHDSKRDPATLMHLPSFETLMAPGSSSSTIIGSAGIKDVAGLKAALKQQMIAIQKLFDDTDGFKKLVSSNKLVSKEDQKQILKMMQKRFQALKSMLGN